MIKAKGLMLARFTSSLIVLIALLIVFLLDLIIVHDPIFYIILLTLTAILFLLIIGLSLEVDYFRNHSRIFISVYILGIASAELYVMITNVGELNIYSLFILNNLIGFLSWKYALSINKIKKKLFCFLCIAYYLINLALQFNILLLENYLIMRFIFVQVVLINIALILIIEYIMKRKGYLKYL